MLGKSIKYKIFIIILIALIVYSFTYNKGISSAEQLPVPSIYESSSSVLEAPIQVPKKTYPKGCEHYRDIVEQYDWDTDIAMQVMMAESGCNPEVVNWGDSHKGCVGSTGLFQIGCINAPIEEMKNPYDNIKKAHELYSQRGWQPWGVCTNGTVKCTYIVHTR